ncbi:hypothetical protein D3C87_1930400 [compost metagenome]
MAMALVALPSISTMWSPLLRPALAAGVSSMGATTESCLSLFMPIWMPIPKNEPWRSSCIDLKTLGSMKRV